MSPLISCLPIELLLNPPDPSLIQNDNEEEKVLKLLDHYGVDLISFCEINADK